MIKKQEKEKIFNNLYLSYKNDLIRYAISLTKNLEQAEDLLQDTYSIAWSKLEDIRTLDKAKYWLMTTMRREFLKGVEKNKFKKTIDFENMSEILETNENSEKSFELDEIVNFLNKDLSRKYSKILIMHSIMGYKISEIAVALKLPENTVSTRLARSRIKILEKTKI